MSKRPPVEPDLILQRIRSEASTISAARLQYQEVFVAIGKQTLTGGAQQVYCANRGTIRRASTRAAGLELLRK